VVVLERSDGSRIEYTYDANGCVVRKARIAGGRRDEWQYGWDSRQRLTSMVAPNGAVWRYRYDATSRRLEKLSPVGESWRYVWRGQDMADVLYRPTAEAESVLVERYLHEPGGTCPLLRQDASGAVHYILPDQNDSPSEEVVQGGGSLSWQAGKGTSPRSGRRRAVSGAVVRRRERPALQSVPVLRPRHGAVPQPRPPRPLRWAKPHNLQSVASPHVRSARPDLRTERGGF
jgi:YD repeat-containing protein